MLFIMGIFLAIAAISGNTIGVLLMSSAMSDWASAKDWERSEYNAEKRHKELMELQKKKPAVKREAARRRIYRDENGRFMSEEAWIREYGDEE